MSTLILPVISSTIVKFGFDGLAAVNKVFGSDSPLRIDELFVLKKSQPPKAEFALLLDDRPLEKENIIALVQKMNQERRFGSTHEFIELDGQEAENFDFILEVEVFNDDLELAATYLVFGNYLGGTMENLRMNPYWTEVQNRFYVFADRLCTRLSKESPTC